MLQILAVAKTHDERVGMEQRIQLVRRRARASGVGDVLRVERWPTPSSRRPAERPDVAIVGARHNRWLARLLGSVSGKVAQEAPCRVEIVPD